MKDYDDAVAYGLAVREALETIEEANPGSVIFAKPTYKPDPEHPGVAFARYVRELPNASAVTRRMEGGHVFYGEFDCARCSRECRIEAGVSTDGHIVDSVGGVIYSDQLALCDECSPI